MDERTRLRRPLRASHPGSVLFWRFAGRHVRLRLPRGRGGVSAARLGIHGAPGGYRRPDCQHHAGGFRCARNSHRRSGGRDRPQPYEAFRHGGAATAFPLPDPAGLPVLGHRRAQGIEEGMARCPGGRRKLRAGSIRLLELLGTLCRGHRRRHVLHRLRDWASAGLEARPNARGGGPGETGESAHAGGEPDRRAISRRLGALGAAGGRDGRLVLLPPVYRGPAEPSYPSPAQRGFHHALPQTLCRRFPLSTFGGRNRGVHGDAPDRPAFPDSSPHCVPIRNEDPAPAPHARA